MVAVPREKKERSLRYFLFCCVLGAREEYWNRILWARGKGGGRKEGFDEFLRTMWEIAFARPLMQRRGQSQDFTIFNSSGLRRTFLSLLSGSVVGASGKKKLCALPCTDSDEEWFGQRRHDHDLARRDMNFPDL